MKGRPRTLGLLEIIHEFIEFRLEVIQRRTAYDLKKALERAHLLIGLLAALDYIDQVVDLIRKSSTPDEAKEGLMKGAFIDDLNKFWEKFRPLIDIQSDDLKPEDGYVLTEVQAKAILELRLQRLTGLERDKIKGEYEDLQVAIQDYRDILASEERQRNIIKDELAEIVDKYGDARRTQIEFQEVEINMEDMIPDDEVVISISHLGYIKRTPVAEYRTQSRGGRGSIGAKTRNEDWVEHMFVASNHNYLLLFTESGRVHWMRVYEIPEASKTSSGRVIQNILPIPKDDKVRAYIKIKDLNDQEFLENHFILFCTKKGIVKKTPVEAYSRPRSNGIQAITINEGDQLFEVKMTNGSSEIFSASSSGNAIRFDEGKVRSMGRTAAGVRGISLDDKDEVVRSGFSEP
ncbi:MAG: DNA gyrase C-terminal beta-propeller domain-containing protein [Saprospiraceae bacterium]